MINLKDNIEERLWNSIKKNYNSENYTNAILDSIQFLGDIIREKSGLEGDGQTLVGSAFGGENPKIKLNKQQTESEKNFQKGTEQILRGIYSAYRNPRSHTKYEDTEFEAIEIIFYINHLVKTLDKSKGKFSTEIFLQRVFDEDFVEDKKYSDILVRSIPSTKYFEVMIELFKNKNDGATKNIKYVWSSLINELNDEQKKELHELASEELRFTDSPLIVIKCIGLFSKSWDQIDEDARFRAENKIIKLIPLSEKDIYGNLTQEGIYVTWLTSIIDKSVLIGTIADELENLFLTRNQNKQRFVLEYFGRDLKKLDENLVLASFDDHFIEELKNGNELVYNYLSRKHRINSKEYAKFKVHLDEFKVKPEPEDDLPF